MSEEFEQQNESTEDVPQSEPQTDSQTETTEGTGQTSEVDFKALKDKYLGQGKSHATREIQQQLIDAKIFNSEGHMTPELADYLQNQQPQNEVQTPNDNNQYLTPAKLDEALKFREDQRNLDSTASSGMQKYGEKWPEIAKTFVDDSKIDPDASGVVQAVTGRQNGHEILEYLNRHPQEYEKFKGMKPRLLNLTLNNLTKNLTGTVSELAAAPLTHSKASTQSSSNARMSKYERMVQKKEELKTL